MDNREITTTISKGEYEKYFAEAVSFEDYLAAMKNAVDHEEGGLYAHYIPLNLQRTVRIAKTFHLNAEIAELLPQLHHTLNWLVISEHWCGDASQLLPIINAIALASNGKIVLKIAYRDQNPDLISAHLSNGTKSIPKLIQLDSKFAVTAVWGPRPKEAQQLVERLKADPITAMSYADKLHKWYADDKGSAIQKELLKVIKIGIAFCPDCFVR